MTSHAGRLYSIALALVVFFLAWAVVAAHPWQTAAADPRLKALSAREALLRREASLVAAIAKAKATAVSRPAAVASAQPVRIVTLPPLTITRTS